jgi:hypothetical protein
MYVALSGGELQLRVKYRAEGCNHLITSGRHQESARVASDQQLRSRDPLQLRLKNATSMDAYPSLTG